MNERTITAYGLKLREREVSPAPKGRRRKPNNAGSPLGLSAATIHAHFRYLKAALRWAHAQKFIHEVPKFLMPKVPKGTGRAKVRAAARLTNEEYERLLMKAPNDGWRLLIAFAWHAGLRLQEARNVEGDHVDMERHLIRLPRNKAGDLDAVAFMTPDLDAYLRAAFPDGLPRGRLIRADEVPTDPTAASRGFGTIARAASVRGGSKTGYLTFHDLRRAYGSRWSGKVPAQVLQRMMRHANIATTMTYYADVEQAAILAAWGPEADPEPAT